jgi:limonene-1,2-epoxide hydrolase
MNRRKALTIGGAASAAALFAPAMSRAQTVTLTAQERANIRVVDDFIAAWNAKDAAKVQSSFASDARFALGAIGKTKGWPEATAKDGWSPPDFVDYIKNAKSIKMTVTPGTTWARGPVVTHERTDEIQTPNQTQRTAPPPKYIAVFTLRDGKIVDFIDFSLGR